MKFVKKESKLISIEELDEALCIEGKTSEEIEKVSRRFGSALVCLRQNSIDSEWRNSKHFPVKVSNTAIYMGLDERSVRGEITKVKLTGVPPRFTFNDIVSWLSWYGEIKDNIVVHQVKKAAPFNNIGGIVDITGMEVKMFLNRHFREKEFVEGHCI